MNEQFKLSKGEKKLKWSYMLRDFDRFGGYFTSEIEDSSLDYVEVLAKFDPCIP